MNAIKTLVHYTLHLIGIVSDAEMGRVIEEFEVWIQKKQNMDYHHHEQNKHA